MTSLSVNVNKIATLRNSRGGENPNLVKMCRDIISFGAHGITVHPRPDERHIKKSDVYDIAELLKQHNLIHPDKIEFNMEGYPSEEYLNLVAEIKPDQATLVPDPPEVLTSNAGWKIKEQLDFLKEVNKRLKNLGVRVSLFIDPFQFSSEDLSGLQQIGCDRIELYTEKFATDFKTNNRVTTTLKYKQVAQLCEAKGVEVNAGHDLDLQNLGFLLQQIPQIREVSIGHAMICEALYEGYETVLKKYLDIIKKA